MCELILGVITLRCGFDRALVVFFFRCSVFPRQRPCCSGMQSHDNKFTETEKGGDVRTSRSSCRDANRAGRLTLLGKPPRLVFPSISDGTEEQRTPAFFRPAPWISEETKRTVFIARSGSPRFLFVRSSFSFPRCRVIEWSIEAQKNNRTIAIEEVTTVP